VQHTEPLTQDRLESRAATGPHCFLYREALQNEYADLSVPVRSSGVFYARPFQDREKQLRCYLCESLLTALEHPDPVIRVRAAVQAFAYAGRLEGMGKSPGSRHCDTLLEVRNWLESAVSLTASTNGSMMGAESPDA
jgi:hypothetical protein